VKDGYAFVAIALEKHRYGTIVSGREPEYEDVAPICESFMQFLVLLSSDYDGVMDQ